MPEPTIHSAGDRASHPARVDAARALATFDHNAAYVEMIECQDHPVWHDYLGRADVALAAKVAQPELETGAAPCPECGSTSPRELSIGKRIRNEAPDPLRLRMHDIAVLVLEACPDCGEQTNATDADQFLANLEKTHA